MSKNYINRLLLHACMNGDLDQFNRIVKHGDFDINYTDNHGRNMLMIAHLHGNFNMVSPLILQKISLDHKDEWGNDINDYVNGEIITDSSYKPYRKHENKKLYLSSDLDSKVLKEKLIITNSNADGQHIKKNAKKIKL